jgi:hypothetical protein
VIHRLTVAFLPNELGFTVYCAASSLYYAHKLREIVSFNELDLTVLKECYAT